MPGKRILSIPSTYPLQDVIKEVSDNDVMLSGYDYEHYLAVGTSALAIIAAALATRGVAEVRSILDMPCGHGRVTRVLRAAFPNTDIHVCDLDEDGVRFCAKTFRAKPLVSQPNFKAIDFGHRFDLIWVGSLITHLPAAVATASIEFALRHLTDKGVAVVSSHGPFVAGRIQTAVMQGGEGYGTGNDAARRMLEDYFNLGFGYADYPDVDLSVQNYGISLATRAWTTATVEHVGGEVVFYHDHAWDRHHDVIAFRRARRDDAS